MNGAKRWAVALAILAWSGCRAESHDRVENPDPAIPAVGASASAILGSAGGTIELEGLRLEIPPGALSAPTELRVVASAARPPDRFTSFSPTFRFEPEGTTFATPVTVRLPFDGDPLTASVFWTAANDSGAYVALPTRIEGGVAITETTHLRVGFVGSACDGGCCERANGNLDVLLMVDDSGSMREEQASLAEQIPRMARVFATGDLDGDGAQDFPALHSVRIGTVSSDLGTGGATVQTCSLAEFGDDGILQTGSSPPAAGCAASYAPFAELRADDPAPGIDAFVEHVSCVSRLGVAGCGFEQQLEAVLKATTPSTSDLRFFRDTTGHADGANAGFLRAESILATILLTDEDDCSVRDPDLFNPESLEYSTTDLNLRCFAHPEALHPIARYVDGLRASRQGAGGVVLGVIAGVPEDLVADPDAIDLDAVLADPRMTPRIDPEGAPRLAPSCAAPGRGMAFPPQRLVQVARDFGEDGVVQSICQADYTAVVDAILTRVARRVSGACTAP